MKPNNWFTQILLGIFILFIFEILLAIYFGETFNSAEYILSVTIGMLIMILMHLLRYGLKVES